MKRAILHIGTEKTGTTSIQKFLFQNHSKLIAAGILFPASAGFISNQRLVVYGKKAPEQDIAEPSLDVNNAVALSQWKEQFVTEHCAEVLAFQARHNINSTVVYSAEHLQSRLTTVDEIKRVARLLRPLFDEVKILVYLRRQDRYALSAHSTSVRGGNQNNFTFENIHAEGPYYNYRELLENWSEVFGSDALKVRVFEQARLIGGDVVSDFSSATGIDTVSQSLDRPESENEALSYTALSILRSFNALSAHDPRLHGCVKPDIRPYLLDQVQKVHDNFGRLLPSRDSAERFYNKFKADNHWIANRWLDGDGFNELLSDYPDVTSELPVISNIDQRLDEMLVAFSNS